MNPHKRNAYKILSLARLPVPTLPHIAFHEEHCPLATEISIIKVKTNVNTFFVLCGRWDLNPHERNAHKILSLARLPVPTLPHIAFHRNTVPSRQVIV